ncbi:uncharacterized protein LOC127263787 isoform X2 [Andrographis paniculata]|uniref:uncharacterized protein LOC127263787 isoform X2 n=1 Tax=Andrographis paniculata TaxID=175694 RepID=UPI0021E99081|nr:uncharacterized protein LOC127263787 isoform X2 [Andrographis paniculata]
MGDHFVLLVDRMLTESTLEAAIESRISSKQAAPPATAAIGVDSFSQCKASAGGVGEVVECRICQDEDVDLNMEAPCSCSGSLKYAHRKCIQRWCNEKGDTTCEICHTPFKPGYTAPPPIFRLRRLPVNLRGNWRITRTDPDNPHIIAMVSTDRTQTLLDPEYDEYAASTLRSIVCCRTVAIILMILLIIRHTLPVIVSQPGDYSFALLVLLALRIAGIVVPICILLRGATSVLENRGRQEQLQLQLQGDIVDVADEEETGSEAHVITIQQLE